MTNDQLLTIIISLGGLILTSTIAIGGLILAQSRAIRSELREGLREAARDRTALRDHVDTQIGNLRDRMDTQIGNLRDRMGRIEGALDILREFFLGSGRGTAA